MTTMTQTLAGVTVGVDTHRDIHVAAVLDSVGRVLDTGVFLVGAAGYDELIDWAGSFGPINKAGIEGTGSWGAGLVHHARHRGIDCVEVNRPNRQHRRRYGKSDTADALAAARAVQSGEATGEPRGRSGPIEGLRTNRVAIRSANKARTQAINQLRALIVTAPESLRARLSALSQQQLIDTVARFRTTSDLDVVNTTKHAMRSVARRIKNLTGEITELDELRQRLVTQAAPPELMTEHGVGSHVAADLLIAFGDNPNRISSDASFAALVGVSPVDASSGLNQRHRLNRGGDRQANSALWRIVTVRMAHHQPTRDYITRRLEQGKTKREAIRSLKRYTARRIWRILKNPPQPPLDNL